MRRLLLLVVLLGLATPAGAVGPVLQTCTFDWGMPTVNVDGTALTNLASFNIYLSSTAGGTGAVLGNLPAPSATPVAGATYTFVCPSGMTNGQKYATATAVNTLGQESARSNEVPFVFGSLSSLPAAPSALSVRATVVTPTISSLPTSGPGNTTVTVSIRNGPGNPKDWVRIQPVGSPPSTMCCGWAYLNGTSTAPTVGLTSADFSLFINANPPGAYELRFFSNDTLTLITSVPFTVN